MKITKCSIDEVVVAGFSYQPEKGVLLITCVLFADGVPVTQATRPAPMNDKIDTSVKELCQVLEQAVAEEIGQVDVKPRKLPRGISDQDI